MMPTLVEQPTESFKDRIQVTLEDGFSSKELEIEVAGQMIHCVVTSNGDALQFSYDINEDAETAKQHIISKSELVNPYTRIEDPVHNLKIFVQWFPTENKLLVIGTPIPSSQDIVAA